MNQATDNTSKLRLLVAIASFGDKHIEYLKQIIATYKSMAMTVDVVVVSNNAKDLGKDVKVLVGLPSKNPWSLPFAHKPVFVENVDRYDLFAYSEDDILITEKNIRAFLRATSKLPENEIAGHLLYEKDASDKMWLPNFHWHFHWKPESVEERNGYTVAQFTNEHSASYLLTQSQLKRAIASGGFLRAPYAGHYDMLCAAATDPFTSCGLRKVICISELDGFLLHHMPNKYVGKVGIPADIFNQQIQALINIKNGTHPATALCQLETKMPEQAWSKNYYEHAQEDLVRLVPEKAKTVLSVGCGWGETEAMLKQRGFKVTALPIDSVMGAVAAQRGVEMVYGSLEEGLKKLGGRKFDCVLMSDLLHLLPEPKGTIESVFGLLEDGGKMLISGPNFDRMPIFFKRIAGRGDFQKLRSFKQSGINICGPGTVAKHARNAGLQVKAVKWINHALPGRRLAKVQMELGGLTAQNWILEAKR